MLVLMYLSSFSSNHEKKGIVKRQNFLRRTVSKNNELKKSDQIEKPDEIKSDLANTQLMHLPIHSLHSLFYANF